MRLFIDRVRSQEIPYEKPRSGKFRILTNSFFFFCTIDLHWTFISILYLTDLIPDKIFWAESWRKYQNHYINIIRMILLIIYVIYDVGWKRWSFS